MDDLVSFFVRKCMFMTSPHSQEVDSLRCAGNMHSSYYNEHGNNLQPDVVRNICLVFNYIDNVDIS